MILDINGNLPPPPPNVKGRTTPENRRSDPHSRAGPPARPEVSNLPGRRCPERASRTAGPPGASRIAARVPGPELDPRGPEGALGKGGSHGADDPRAGWRRGEGHGSHRRVEGRPGGRDRGLRDRGH